MLATAYECGIPIFTSSPGDSSIGMNVAAMALRESKLTVRREPRREPDRRHCITKASLPSTKAACSFSAAVLRRTSCSRPSRKSRRSWASLEKGHDYFLQCTDARPDTGGLSGATPAEAVSWGKVDPDTLPDCVVCYTDSTISLPLLTAYMLSRVKPRTQKRLYDRRDAILEKVRAQYLKTGTVSKITTSRKLAKRSTGVGTKTVDRDR